MKWTPQLVALVLAALCELGDALGFKPNIGSRTQPWHVALMPLGFALVILAAILVLGGL